MKKVINISVRNNSAWQTNRTDYVCGNSGFTVAFDFDNEWVSKEKTARFAFNGKHVDVVFTGNRCAVPKIFNASKMEVGVFAGDLMTTTAAVVKCRKSILCGDGVPANPTPDVYAQIMEKLNEVGVTDDQVSSAVAEYLAEYLAENPVKAGATIEEATQIQQNKEDIDKLSTDKLDASKLPEAVGDALAQAKASGEFKGEPGEPGQPGQDGYTPIKGEDYFDGADGKDGKDYVLTEADKQEIAEQAAQMVEIPQGTGITDAEKNLILSLFRNAAYTSDAMGNTLAQLEELWSGGDVPDIPDEPDVPDEPVVATYTVTSALFNVTSTNASAVVNEGESYTATLTADEGYKVDSVVVTMGGNDVTASAYADGVVNIPSVTGAIVITAVAVELDYDIAVEYGTIINGVENDSTARIRTMFVPFDSENNKVRVDVLINGGTDIGYITTPYDGAFNQIYGSEGAMKGKISPRISENNTVPNHAENSTDYEISYSGNTKYLRFCFRNSTNAEIISFLGRVTVSGVTYNLEKVGYHVETFPITYNLTNASTSNEATSVTLGESYSATLLPSTSENYFRDVTVTMGGEDVTASVYANGEINIPFVTGAIVITAVAVELVVIDCEIGRIAGATGEAMDDTTIYVRSDFIPFDPATPTMLVNATINGNISASFMAAAYDSNKNWIDNLRRTSLIGSVTPTTNSAKAGWCDHGIEYTARHPDEIAYVRLTFASPGDVDVTSFSGTATISGVEYQLQEV